ATSLRDRPENSRQITARLSRDRGPIVVGGQAVAESVPSNDQYKFQRTYPGGALYGNLTGYYGFFGSTGIEKSEDDLLSGEDKRLFVRRISDLFTGRSAKGGSAVLTIRPEVQQAAADALGGRKGAVVALNPTTGAVLAMVSQPSYNPAPLASHDGRAATTAEQALNGDSGDPLINRAAQGLYPPGSTFKVVTSAAALSNGYNSQSQIPAPTSLLLANTRTTLPNFQGESCNGNGRTTLTDALTTSCNTAFAQLGINLPGKDDALRRQAEAFGFNADLQGFPLPTSTSRFPQGLDDAQTEISSIGQGNVLVTPLQMAMVASAVANGGRLMKPYLVDKTLAPDLTTLQTTSPEEQGRPMSGDVASQLTQMMQSVVQNGTGTAAQLSVPVAGKTGSAENVPGRPTHAWFIGFAPADNPQVAVAVIVENGGTGGTVAAPIARQVMSKALGLG
ncbi:MAG: penicillin-binding protein, partial [Frankiaceae bacterium]|nr:penicillin-binding protein [Frankiaceae bacterium]